MTVAATAEHGRFLATDDPDKILFRLTKGRLVQDSPEVRDAPHARLRQLRPAGQPAGDRPVPRPRRHRRAEELYLHELWRLGYGGAASSACSADGSRSHFNFRMVEVVMMLMLPLLAVALAVPPKRSSSGARHLRLDPDRRRLSQGQPICRSRGGRRPARPDAWPVGAADRPRRR